MNVAIIGFGVEGRSALHYWQDQGATVTICDQNPDLQAPAGVRSHLGEQYLEGLEQYDLVVRSAGIRPGKILAQNPGLKDRLTTVVNEFFRVCPTKNIIGITGTKGKGTTSSLIARMLEVAGKHVMLGGNIGFSPLEFLPHLTPESFVVLELSSFQLIDLQHSPHIAVCLMIAPEHLNWHADMDEYTNAKAQLFAHQNADDIAIYFASSPLSHQIASHSPGKKLAYYAPPGAFVANGQIMIDDQPLCKTSELQLLGVHNWQNACAAATVLWQIVQAPEAIRTVLTSFAGLPHRLEFVAEKDDIKYYNDSFASAPPAAEAAIEAIPGKKVIIIGGFDRNLPLDKLANTVRAHQKDIRQVLLIGASAERVAAELDAAGVVDYTVSAAANMRQIVRAARGFAKSGDAVVLSPGFPSFDMFKNFEERGNLFKTEVSEL